MHIKRFLQTTLMHLWQAHESLKGLSILEEAITLSFGEDSLALSPRELWNGLERFEPTEQRHFLASLKPELEELYRQTRNVLNLLPDGIPLSLEPASPSASACNLGTSLATLIDLLALEHLLEEELFSTSSPTRAYVSLTIITPNYMHYHAIPASVPLRLVGKDPANPHLSFIYSWRSAVSVLEERFDLVEIPLKTLLNTYSNAALVKVRGPLPSYIVRLEHPVPEASLLPALHNLYARLSLTDPEAYYPVHPFPQPRQHLTLSEDFLSRVPQ